MNAQSGSETFDYVIVGGGTAGCLLAARLSEASDISVCLIEAGPPDRHPMIHIPAGFIHIMSNPSFTWRYESEPSEGTGGRRISAVQGRTLGGSSAINGMFYNRCQAEDYERWAQMGNTGWSYRDVVPYFQRSETRLGGDDRLRGRAGELLVSDPTWSHPVCTAFLDAAKGAGIPVNPDYNGFEQAGVGYVQRMISGRWRETSATAFLSRARRRGNLRILTDAKVRRVLVGEGRATGVIYSYGRSNEVREARVRREVIICAGALNSPALLQRSGIGPADRLQAAGVDVVHDLPGVGENLRDHYCVRLVMRAKNAVTINERSRGVRLAAEVFRWAVGLPSILTLSPSVMHLFWKSEESLDIPDIQGVFAPASYRAGIVGVLDHFPGMTLGFYQQRPQSAGHVRVRSPDPMQPPEIQPNYLAEETDRNALVGGLRLGRRIFARPELSHFVDREELPGTGAADGDALLDYARSYGSTVYHFSGSCRMAPATDRTAVVDPALRVHGIGALRVVDASIMPFIPSGNTTAPVLMIAEKAADLILGRQPAAPTI